MADSRRFAIVGCGPYSNRGCEAIIRGTVEVLSRRFPDATYIVSSFGETPANTQGIETDPRIEHRPPREGVRRFQPGWWRYALLRRISPGLVYREQNRVQLEALRESVCALQAGGDNYSLDYGAPSAFVRLDEALLPTGKPLILWGASVGPFSARPDIENRMRAHLRKLSLICARETETVAYLSSIGVTENVRLVADPAFTMPAKQPSLPDEMSRFVERKPIGLNLTPLLGKYRAAEGGPDWPSVAGDCIRAVADLDAGPVLLVPHVFQGWNDDRSFMKEAAADLPGWGDRLDILPPTLSAAEFKWAISKLCLFVGARTHATIAALSSCVPTISLGYSMKSSGINKDIFGHADWRLPATELTPDMLVGKVKELLSGEDDVRRQLEASIPTIKERAYSAADHVAELLG